MNVMINDGKEKCDYSKLLFSHGICFDKKNNQVLFNEMNLSIADVYEMNKYLPWGKHSRYCLVGKLNYNLNQLELGLSMIEYPYRYVKKTAREVAIKNMNEKNYFSLIIPFDMLMDVPDDLSSISIRLFTKFNDIIANMNRGSLIYLFKDKNLKKITKLNNQSNISNGDKNVTDDNFFNLLKNNFTLNMLNDSI